MSNAQTEETELRKQLILEHQITNQEKKKCEIVVNVQDFIIMTGNCHTIMLKDFN